MKRKPLPIAANVRLLSAIIVEHPHINSQLVDRRIKAGLIDRWTREEILKVPDLYLPDTGWTESVAANAYFYDMEQVIAAIADTGKYENIAPVMAPRAKEKLRLGLAAAYNDGNPPTGRNAILQAAKAWSGAFQRNITLTTAEVALFDAITRLMRGDRSNPRISWIGLFKRWMGHFIVAVHPAMVDRDYRAYFAWVNGPDFDLLTLVGSLGYDDLDDFAAQLMLPIEAARYPNSYQHKQNLWDALGKTDLPDSSHPLYAPLSSLKVQVAEGAADAVILKATGIPQFRDAVEMMAMIRNPKDSSPDLHKIMQTISMLNEHGFEFVNGQITVTDHDKALTFRDSLKPALDDSFARRQKERTTV
jgi:hypothetical protein